MSKKVIKTHVQGNGNIVNNTVTGEGNISITTRVNGEIITSSSTSSVSPLASVLTAAGLMMLAMYLVITGVVHLLATDGKDVWTTKVTEVFPGAKIEASCSLPGEITFKGTVPLNSVPTSLNMQAPALSCVFFSPYTGESRKKLLAYLHTERASQYAKFKNIEIAVTPEQPTRKQVDIRTLSNNISGQ